MRKIKKVIEKPEKRKQKEHANRKKKKKRKTGKKNWVERTHRNPAQKPW